MSDQDIPIIAEDPDTRLRRMARGAAAAAARGGTVVYTLAATLWLADEVPPEQWEQALRTAFAEIGITPDEAEDLSVSFLIALGDGHFITTIDGGEKVVLYAPEVWEQIKDGALGDHEIDGGEWAA